MLRVRAPIARSPWLFDGVLAAVLAVLGAAELAAQGDVPVETVVLAELVVLPVGFRRVAPAPTALVVAGVLVVGTLQTEAWPDTFSTFAALLAVAYAVGEAGFIVVAVAALGLLLLAVAIASDDVLPDLAFPAVMWTIAWLSGRAVGAHRRQTAQLHALAGRLARERESSARLAVVEERARVTDEVARRGRAHRGRDAGPPRVSPTH